MARMPSRLGDFRCRFKGLRDGMVASGAFLNDRGCRMRPVNWSRIEMRAVRTLVGLVGLALALGAGIAGQADEQSVRLACNNFPPHKIEQPADDGHAGFDIDIVSEALKRIGWSTEIAFMPWKRALELAERGQYDGLCSCSHT